MSDKIKITCQRCGHTWERSLAQLEHTQTIYRGDEKNSPKIVEVRAACPVCGTHHILEIQED